MLFENVYDFNQFKNEMLFHFIHIRNITNKMNCYL
jgi:hypothetical protein